MKNELSEEDLEKIREIVHDEIGKLIRAMGMTLEQLAKQREDTPHFIPIPGFHVENGIPVRVKEEKKEK